MSGNVSNHVWVEDASKPLGGYWVREKGTADGEALVSIAGGIVDPLTGGVTVQEAGVYETVAAAVTAQIMGTTGQVGDYIGRICAVGTSATQTITVIDDSSNVIVLELGDEYKEFNLGWHSKNGAWKITTSAAVSCVVSGAFL